MWPRLVAAAGLAALGVVTLGAAPGPHTLAQAHVALPGPAPALDLLRALPSVTHGADVTVSDGRAVVVVEAASRRHARDLAARRAHEGLDAALARVTNKERARARAASGEAANAAAELAALQARAGLTDPTPAYQASQTQLRSLQQRRERAAAAGQPVGALDALIAVDQQSTFELQLQVTRHNDLVRAETDASRRAATATATVDAVTGSVRSATVRVIDHATGGWPRVPLAIVTFALAAIVAGTGALRGRRHGSRARRGLVAARSPVPSRAPGPPPSQPTRIEAPPRIEASPTVEATREPEKASSRPRASASATEEAALPEPPPALDLVAEIRDSVTRELDFYRALATPPSEPEPVDLVAEEERGPDQPRDRPPATEPTEPPAGEPDIPEQRSSRSG